MPPTSAPPERLFDEDSRRVAAQQHHASAYRALVRDERPGGAALRAVLERAWSRAGDSRLALRRGLEHERWGQHAGALAHLLTLAALDELGWAPRSEPRVGGRRPDLLVHTPGGEALVEVRSFAGAGQRPWEAGADRAARRLPAPTPGEQPDRRARSRLASQRAEAAAALERDLGASLDRVLRGKAATYAETCRRAGLPLLITLYGDTDEQLAGRVRAWTAGLAPADPELTHVPAVLVLGRRETPADGDAVTLTAAWVPLPCARATLAPPPALADRGPGPVGPLDRHPAAPTRLRLPRPPGA